MTGIASTAYSPSANLSTMTSLPESCISAIFSIAVSIIPCRIPILLNHFITTSESRNGAAEVWVSRTKYACILFSLTHTGDIILRCPWQTQTYPLRSATKKPLSSNFTFSPASISAFLPVSQSSSPHRSLPGNPSSGGCIFATLSPVATKTPCNSSISTSLISLRANAE